MGLQIGTTTMENNVEATQKIQNRTTMPGLRRSPAGGHGSPLQYSCLENPMDRGAWWDTVCGITELDTIEVT